MAHSFCMNLWSLLEANMATFREFVQYVEKLAYEIWIQQRGKRTSWEGGMYSSYGSPSKGKSVMRFISIRVIVRSPHANKHVLEWGCNSAILISEAGERQSDYPMSNRWLHNIVHILFTSFQMKGIFP
jgi:hypothetical protein